MLFYGSFEHVLDEKNRLAIPADFREADIDKHYGKGFFITCGTENCLFLFKPVHWEEFVNRIQSKPFSAKRRKMIRAFLWPARKLVCDSQGRVVIPQELKEFANLEKNVVLSGAGNMIEIWNVARWREMYREIDTERDKLTEELLGGAASSPDVC